MKKTTLFLLSIIALAALLRLYRLPDIPPGVNRDEASIGVTAYSLMTTGKDEYGRSFPLSFESFGDWKLPVYIYSTIPFIRFFGLSELSVRLLSALAGIISVAALYFLSYILFSSQSIALLSAFVLAIMPWHVHISRVESEAIVATLFTILGSLAFFQSLKKKRAGTLIIAAILFSATYYTYHGSHITTTLLVIGLFSIFRKQILSVKHWWIALAAGAILTGYIFSVTLSADHTKLSGIGIFGDPTSVHTHIELPRIASGNPNSIIVRLRYNRVTYALSTITKNYLASYGPHFLFIQGGGNRAHTIQGYGNLHPVDALFLYTGIAVLIISGFTKNKTVSIRRKQALYVFFWIAISGIASAITKDAPHSNRMLAITPALAICISTGVIRMASCIPRSLHTASIAIMAGVYLVSLVTYTHLYFTVFPKNEAGHWGYAYAKLAPQLFTSYAGYHIIMTKPQESPYIFLLFYGGYPPALYQEEAIRYPISKDGFTDVAGFGRFSFRPIQWETDATRSGTLLIAAPEEIPDTYASRVKHTILLPDGSIRWMILPIPYEL